MSVREQVLGEIAAWDLAVRVQAQRKRLEDDILMAALWSLADPGEESQAKLVATVERYNDHNFA